MIRYAEIEAQIATDIGAGISGGVNSSLAKLDVPATALVAVYTWDGTGVVATPDTSEVVVGSFIRLDSDASWFRVAAILPNTSVFLANDYGSAFPTGATPSSLSDVGLPPASSSESIEDSLGTAIAAAVVAALQTFAGQAEISGTTAGIATIGPGVIN